MAKNTQSNQQTETTVDVLRQETMALGDTSKKIRHLLGAGKSIKEIYHLLKEYGVTTKGGDEIRYQHVRNVAMTKLTTK